jgi:hypothetical protein
MPSSSFKRLLFLIGGLLLCIAAQVPLFINGNFFSAQSAQLKLVTNQTHTPSTASTSTTALAVSPTPSSPRYQRPNFETGVVFPQWTQDAYGPADTKWQQGLSEIQTQTGARWIEMTILFSQPSETSTQVTLSTSAPTIEAFAAGISAARALGYHVFVVPLFGVDSPPGAWAATIHFSAHQQEVQWFDSYWQAFQPYIQVAAQSGADQVSIGTELQWLEQSAPASLWNTLVARVRGIFPGMITYDMNWTSLSSPPTTWMNNRDLAMIGVSEYMPLVDVRVRVEPKDMFALWKVKVKAVLDKMATQLGKPILISEIGYRNSADTLYNPWYPTSTTSPPDPEEQAAACDAALANVFHDPLIGGIFFWGWDDVIGFKLSGQPAVKVLHTWFTSPQS